MSTFLQFILLGCSTFFAVGLTHSTSFLSSAWRVSFTPTLTQTQLSAITTTHLALFLGTQFVTAIVFHATRKGSPLRYLFLMLGTITWTSGVFGTAYSFTYEQLFGIYGALVSIGASILYWGPLELVKDSQRGTLILLIFASISEAVFFTLVSPWYGTEEIPFLGMSVFEWRAAVQIIGMVGAPICLLTQTIALLINRSSYRPYTLSRTMKPTISPTSIASAKYITLIISATFFFVVSITPYSQLVPYLQSTLDFSTIEVSAALMTFSIGGVVGRTIPLLLLTLKADPHYWLVISSLVTILVPASWLLVSDFPGACAYGAFAGITSSLQSSLLFTTIANKYEGPYSYLPVSLVSMALGALGSGILYTSLENACGHTCAVGVLTGSQALGFLGTAFSFYI